MSDFKTCGANISYTGISPYTFGGDSGSCFNTNSLSDIQPYLLVLDCKDVTFKLNELDINLNSSNTKQYLNDIDGLVINGIKFIKQ